MLAVWQHDDDDDGLDLIFCILLSAKHINYYIITDSYYILHNTYYLL